MSRADTAAFLDGLASERTDLVATRDNAELTRAGRSAWNQRLFDNFDKAVMHYDGDADFLDDYASRYELYFIAEPRPLQAAFHRSRSW